MRVVLTQAARADLREIGRWIALNNPGRAVTYVRELRAKCSDLARQPLVYPIAEGAAPGVRKRTHGQYLILYRVGFEQIDILRVVHGARDYGLLFDQP